MVLPRLHPDRLTTKETVAYFGESVFVYSSERGVREGMLAPFVAHRVITNVDRDGIVADVKLYTSEDFGVGLLVDSRDHTIVGYCETNFYGRKALVFAASTHHAASLWRSSAAPARSSCRGPRARHHRRQTPHRQDHQR